MLMQIALKRAGLNQPLAIAGDGKEALDYLFGRSPFVDRARHPFPYLILLDLNLPQLSGLEVLQQLRREDAWRDLPVIVFTSSDQQSDRDKAAALGATDYIVKPGKMETLVEFVRDLKRRWPAG